MGIVTDPAPRKKTTALSKPLPSEPAKKPRAPKDVLFRAADRPGLAGVIHALNEPALQAIAADQQGMQNLHESVTTALAGYDADLQQPDRTPEERAEIRADKREAIRLEADRVDEGRSHRAGIFKDNKVLIGSIALTVGVVVVVSKNPAAARSIESYLKSTAKSLPPGL